MAKNFFEKRVKAHDRCTPLTPLQNSDDVTEYDEACVGGDPQKILDRGKNK